MSIIKSHSVGNGDMFYIEHNSDNFTLIDCCLNEDDDQILDDIAALSAPSQTITRFISTHPDDDHLRGLDRLDDRIGILNFYCVKNSATKPDQTDCFDRYCELRDSTKAFHIYKGCSRKWMNREGDGRGQAGISILWPNVNNSLYKAALQDAADGLCPNNISAVIKYSLQEDATALWMGDLETAFMEEIEHELDLPLVDILFAPHHGRKTGRVPKALLETMSPRMIVLGEASSEHLYYYPGYHTLLQNSAGDIVFECVTGAVHIFTSKPYKPDFLVNRYQSKPGYYYAGTLDLTASR